MFNPISPSAVWFFKIFFLCSWGVIKYIFMNFFTPLPSLVQAFHTNSLYPLFTPLSPESFYWMLLKMTNGLNSSIKSTYYSPPPILSYCPLQSMFHMEKRDKQKGTISLNIFYLKPFSPKIYQNCFQNSK